MPGRKRSTYPKFTFWRGVEPCCYCVQICGASDRLRELHCSLSSNKNGNLEKFGNHQKYSSDHHNSTRHPCFIRKKENQDVPTQKNCILRSRMVKEIEEFL
jgi:hypothetical protein